jgi:tRNA G18 (ribose-2'-O)-methylase SpoU
LRQATEHRGGFFVIEGANNLKLALDVRWPLISVLMMDSRAARAGALVAGAEEQGAEVYVAPEAVLYAIAGFRVHRGVLALGRRREPADPAELARATRVALVVEGVNDHENLGALFRNAAALGADAVLLDPTTCDPFYRRSVRVSLGHVMRLPVARVDPWPLRLAALHEAGHTIVGLSPSGERELDGLTPAGPVAVMVGAEGPGLSSAALDAADVVARIPMRAGVDSLNVATAAAIALYHLCPRPRVLL